MDILVGCKSAAVSEKELEEKRDREIVCVRERKKRGGGRRRARTEK